MAIRGVNPWKITEYVPWLELLLPVEKQARFKLQHPDVEKRKKIANESFKSEMQGYKSETSVRQGDMQYNMLLDCVKGWNENVIDDEDKPIPFDGTSPQTIERSLSQLPPDTCDELYNELTKNMRGLRPLIEETARLAKKLGITIPRLEGVAALLA